MKLLLIFLLLLLASGSGFAAEDSHSCIGQQTSPHCGIWHYEQPKEEKVELEELDFFTAPLKEEKQLKQLPLLSRKKMEELSLPMFSAYSKAARRKAISWPIRPNIKNNIVANSVMWAMVMRYTTATIFEKKLMPEVDVSRVFGSNPTALRATTARYLKETESLLRSEAGNCELLYWHSPTCSACKQQELPLSRFLDDFPEWQPRVMNVLAETSKINGVYYPTSELLKKFRVVGTPTFSLICKGSEEFFPVANKVTHADELRSNIYHGIRFLLGEVGVQDMNRFRFEDGGPTDYTKGEF